MSAEQDGLAGVDVFTRGRIVKAERQAELARALTASSELEPAQDLDAFVDAVAERVIHKLSEPREREEPWT